MILKLLFNQTRFNKSIWFYNYKLKFLKLKVDNGYAKWNRKQPLIWLQRRMHSKWRWEKEDQKREKENQKDTRNKILNDSKWFNLCQALYLAVCYEAGRNIEKIKRANQWEFKSVGWFNRGITNKRRILYCRGKRSVKKKQNWSIDEIL